MTIFATHYLSDINYMACYAIFVYLGTCLFDNQHVARNADAKLSLLLPQIRQPPACHQTAASTI
jgi:hypothetical protein